MQTHYIHPDEGLETSALQTVWWPIYVINSGDETKWSCYTPDRISTTVSSKITPFIENSMKNMHGDRVYSTSRFSPIIGSQTFKLCSYKGRLSSTFFNSCSPSQANLNIRTNIINLRKFYFLSIPHTSLLKTIVPPLTCCMMMHNSWLQATTFK